MSRRAELVERTRVLHVGAEIYPFVKTGGLADVIGALPEALIAAGADARVLLPGWALICLLTAGAGWAAPAGLLRPAVLCAWGLCLLGTSGVSLRWPPAEVSNRSARWWLFSVLLLALSSEVLV